MIKAMGINPGTITDKRYAMFGLADKTVFTQAEYDALKAKYPKFESFWVDWKQYVSLLKKSDEISNLASQKDTLQAQLTNLDAMLNSSTVSGGAPLTEQLTIIENALTDIDGKTDAMSLALKQTFTEKENKINDKIKGVNDQKTQINNQIAEIDKKISTYQTDLANIKAKVTQELSDMGGTNPLDAK